jgi:hypothetical protein
MFADVASSATRIIQEIYDINKATSSNIYDTKEYSNGTLVKAAEFTFGGVYKTSNSMIFSYDYSAHRVRFHQDNSMKNSFVDSTGYWQILPHPEIKGTSRVFFVNKITLPSWMPPGIVWRFMKSEIQNRINLVKTQAEILKHEMPGTLVELKNLVQEKISTISETVSETRMRAELSAYDAMATAFRHGLTQIRTLGSIAKWGFVKPAIADIPAVPLPASPPVPSLDSLVFQTDSALPIAKLSVFKVVRIALKRRFLVPLRPIGRGLRRSLRSLKISILTRFRGDGGYDGAM